MTDNNKKTHLIVTGRGGGEQVQADWNQTDSEQPDYIKNKPELATVATTGDYDDLTNKPTIPEAPVQSDWSQTDSTALDYIKNKPNIPSGQVQADWNQTNTSEVDYIKNKPTIPAAQVNSDWNASTGVSQILNKPTLATVATSGNYSDLNGTPSLATVATSGDYDDLQNKPTIPAAPVQSDWNEVDSSSLAYIANKPTIPAAQVQSDWNQSDNTQVDYIANKPTIPAAQVNSDWNSNSGVSQILNKPSLATVATSGNYSDLNGTPTLATVATSGDYDDLSNKPTIPTVPTMAIETLTFTIQGGTTKTIDFYTVPNYFYVENRTNSNGTFTIKKSAAAAPGIEVYSSTDRINWTNMGTTSTAGITISMPANGKTYLKATTNNWGDAQRNYNYINTNYNCNVGGNIMSLLYGDSFVNKTTFPTNNTYVFSRLFSNNEKIISAENLILPATTLKDYCYSNMFEGCASLTTAPALPATTLADGCYSSMFQSCRALTTAPVTLPATTLAQYCYNNMFYKCIALTTAPVLPATTLVRYCYQEMFNVCSSLNKITIYANNISATNCLKAWVNGVAATGDFYRLGSASFPSGASGIPSGWTTHTSL